MYIEIDFDLCAKHGESCTNGAGPQTLNYINVLFAGANTVYEKEIDTHLNVLHVTVNSIYASFTDTAGALNRMTTIYGNGRTSWHFPNADLHHGLLGRNLGGGRASVGALCSPNFGFGLSAALQGKFTQMSSAVVWDFSVFMHEIGHNFGSHHTHSASGYSPLVDNCGNSCPATLPLARSTTLMSHCDLCNGGMSNMAYTFGGTYNGSGDRRLASSYTNSVVPGVSNEPRRVNAVMYTHVASRPNNCLAVPTTTTPTTRSPSQKPTTKKPTVKPVSTPSSYLTDWTVCSNSNQCANQCCSGKYSGGVLKCTPVGGFKTSEGCVGSPSKLSDWSVCSNSNQCTNQCCSGKYSGGVLKCTPVGGFKPSEGCTGSATRQLRGDEDSEEN
ncbi:hypothetical protein ACHAXH_008268 [Discostella pseudostelligera]